MSFRAPDLIQKKRDGGTLTKDEIDWFISRSISGEVQGPQLGAMLMSIYYKGMADEEIVHLTNSYVDSGETFSWPDEWKGLVADKHSTGGVGDKVSLPLAPALAACGLKVPMVSGRGLGFTGGTLDKLESIPGFTVSCDMQHIRRLVDEVGCCIVGQTETLVPADKLIYGVRDVTATVGSLPLITASIVSKKAAERLSALILDTKFGHAALMKDEKSARELAQQMVNVSAGLGVKTRAVLSRMDDPIGYCVGNALEIWETLECLKGQGPADLLQLVAALGGQLLEMTGVCATLEEGSQRILASLKDGTAADKFWAMCEGQGVKKEVVDALKDPNHNVWDVLPCAPHTTDLRALEDGYVSAIDAMAVAEVSGGLGAGRTKAGGDIDHAVGVQLLVHLGDRVQTGDAWVRAHHRCQDLPLDHAAKLQAALELSAEPIPEERKNRIVGVVNPE